MKNLKSKTHAKPRYTKQTIKRVFSYIGRYPFLLTLVVIGILLSTASSIVGTVLLEPAINKFIGPLIGAENPDLSGLITLLLVMGSAYFVGVIGAFMYSRIMVVISTKTMTAIRNELFEKMEKLPIKYFDTHTHGDLMSRYTNDTDTLREMISNGLPQLITSVLTIVGVFIAMVIMSPILTVILVCMLFLMIFIVAKLGSKSGKYFIKQQDSLGKVNGYIEEYIAGQKVVKVFCHEDKVKKSFDEINDTLCANSTKAHTIANILMPILGNISYLNYAITAIVGGVLTIYGFMSIGAIGSFLVFTRTFSNPIMQLSQQFNAFLVALAGAERIFDMIDQEPEKDEGYVTLVNAVIDDKGNISESDKPTGKWAWKHPHGDGTLTYTELKGDVRFVDATFGYEPDKIVLKNISLYAEPGQKIAFVGSTGAGKTTITNLINRFYDIPDGKIRYDGININKIKKPDLRRSLAMVLQDTHLFSGTVKDNVRYGKLDATDEQIYEAAKVANAHQFISRLPDGYDTYLSADGANLSQGQRQLIAIARAAVANPPVLILDEATSSIDTRTEALIEKGMDALMKGKTVFVIAHRLSTVRNSDAIMVLEHGEIIERGSHEELIKLKGKYYQRYTGMFELS